MRDKMIGRTISRGPGGKGCSCCGEAPRSRPAFKRAQKRRERQAWKKAVA